MANRDESFVTDNAVGERVLKAVEEFEDLVFGGSSITPAEFLLRVPHEIRADVRAELLVSAGLLETSGRSIELDPSGFFNRIESQIRGRHPVAATLLFEDVGVTKVIRADELESRDFRIATNGPITLRLTRETDGNLTLAAE